MVHSKLPTSALGKVSQKKSTKNCGDSPNRGGGGGSPQVEGGLANHHTFYLIFS